MQNSSPDLTGCDTEAIQFIESIQPFGSLLAIDKDNIIRSAAISGGFDWTPEQLIGKNVDTALLDWSRVLSAVQNRVEPTSPLIVRTKPKKQWITCIAHKQGDFIILELEVVPPEQIDIASLKFMSDRRESLDSYLSYIAENLRIVTAFDRVMIYKFGIDWHGEVVAESLNSGHSFFGHHFPASDIPVPARNLFTQMWVRIIPDVDATPVRIEGNSSNKLDLSKSVLRAPSSIHLQYLRNMDVAASLTMSIICDGKLWGLIACHHFSPKYLIAEQRAVCSLLAKVVSSRITTLLVAATISATDKIAVVANDLIAVLRSGELLESIRDNKRKLHEFLKCDGFSFASSRGEMVLEGHAPEIEKLGSLVDALNQTESDFVYTDALKDTFPHLEELQMVAAGILAFKVADNWFIWNRQEMVRSLKWAGDPDKPVYSNDKHDSLSPRTSFETWKQSVHGIADGWEQYEITAADRFRLSLQDGLGKAVTPRRADAKEYLRLIRTSINNQAADLQNQFKGLNLEGVEAD